MRYVTFISAVLFFMTLSGQLFANTALHFDSNVEHGDIQHAAHYDVGTGDFTINCIIRFDDYSTEHQNSIFFKGIPNNNYIQLEYSYPEYQGLKFAGRGLPGPEWIAQIVDWTPTINIWYSLAGVREGDSFTVYLIECADVTQVLSAVDTEPGVENPTTTTPWVIGDGVGYHREFLGDIDDVRFWGRALTQQELQAYAATEVNPSDSELLGYWQCNEGAGNVLIDSSPYQRHGQLMGPVTYVDADWSTGGPIGDLVFDDFESGFQTPPWTELDPHVVIEPNGHNGSSQCLALYNNEPWSSGFITAPIVPQQGFVLECWVQRRPNQNNRNYFWFSLTDGPPPDQGQQGMRFRYGRYQHETITVLWDDTVLAEVPISFDYDWTLFKLVRYDNGAWDVYWDNELIISNVSDNFGTLADPHINILGDGFYNEGGVRIDDIRVDATTDQNMAIQLDGSTSYGTAPHDPIMNVGTGDFTIEAMVKGTSWPIPEPTICFKGEGSFGSYFMLGISNTGGIGDGQVHFTAQSWTNPYGSVQVTSNSTLPLNEWHHVAGVREGNTFKLYVDGILHNSEEESIGSLSTEEDFYIGNNVAGNRFFDGCIDEVRFWNDARTPTEITENAFVQLSVNEANLIGLWQMNHESGSTFTDGSGNGNHGTLTGSFDWVPADWSTGGGPIGDLVAHWNCDEGSGSTLHNVTGPHLNGTLYDGATWSTNGHENGSLDIPGYTAGVIVPDHPDLDLTDQIVLDFWFYPHTYAGQWPRIMIGKQHAVSDWCYAVYWGEDNYSDGIVFSIGNGSGGASIHYQESIDLNVWHHLVASYDGAEMRLIIDDQLVGTTVTSEAIGTSDYDLRIGSHFSGPNRSFDGLLDEIKIYRSMENGSLPVDAHTQLLYRFDEAPGTYTAYDATDNHFDLTLSNGAEFTPNGLYGGALDMTAPAPQTANNDLVGNGWTAITIEASIYPTVLGDDYKPVVYRSDWYNVTDPSYWLHVNEDGSISGGVCLNEPGTDYVSMTTPPGLITVDNWYSIMATWHSGDYFRIFVDGELVATGPQNPVGYIREGDDPLGIGYVNQYPYPEDYFDGYIDEVRISDIDRSTQEPPPDDPLTLTLIPHNTQIPPNGGTLNYDVHIVSTLPDRYTNVYYWTNMILPNGNNYPPGGWLISLHANLPPFADIYRTGFTQNVPGYAQPGEYVFEARFGYPNSHFVIDSYTFTKQDGISTGEEVIDWDATGDFDLDDPDPDELLPVEWAVAAATPNPFNPSTTVRVSLPEATDLKLTVTNILGQRVAVLANGYYLAGHHTILFDASGLASGLYFIHANVPGHLNQVQKVMLVR